MTTDESPPDDALLDALPGNERAICRQAARLAESGREDRARQLLVAARRRSDSPKLDRALDLLGGASPGRTTGDGLNEDTDAEAEEAIELGVGDLEIVDDDPAPEADGEPDIEADDSEPENPFEEMEATVVELGDEDVESESGDANPFAASEPAVPASADPGAFDADEATELWDQQPERSEDGAAAPPASDADRFAHDDTSDNASDDNTDGQLPHGADPAAFDEDQPTELYDDAPSAPNSPNANSGPPGRARSSEDPGTTGATPASERETSSARTSEDRADRSAGASQKPQARSAPDRAQHQRPSDRPDSRRASAPAHVTGGPGSRRQNPLASELQKAAESSSQPGRLAEIWQRTRTWLRRAASRRGLLVGATITAALILFGVVAATFLSMRTSSHLADELGAVRRLQVSDTYGGYKRALERLERLAPGAPPGGWSRFVETLGALAPGRPPADYRKALAREADYVRSYLEYRFETPGARLEDPPTLKAPEDHAPVEVAAGVWRALARGDYERAASLVDGSADEASKRLVDARLATYLEAGRIDEAVALADRLDARGDFEAHSPRRLYLLALVARHRDDGAVRAKLKYLLEHKSPSHLDAAIERARTWLDRGAFARAEAEAESLLDGKPNAAPFQKARLRILLGRAYLQRGRMARAEDQFRSATKAAGDRPRVHLPLVDLYLREGRTANARRHLERIEKQAPHTLGLRLRRGELALLEGRPRQALSHLSERSPPSARHAFRLGQSLVLAGQTERARDVFPVESDSKNWTPPSTVWHALARLKSGGAAADELRATVSTTISRHRDRPLVLRAGARFRLHLARSGAADTRGIHLTKARRYLERALEVRESDATARYLLCRVELESGRLGPARSACRRARHDRPEHLRGLATWAEVQLRQGDVQGALTTLESAGKHVDLSWSLARIRIKALLAAHRPKEARKELDDWIARGLPDSAQNLWLEGSIAYAAGDFEAAVGYLKRARRASATVRVRADLYRARALARLEMADEAESIVRRHLADDRHGALAWLSFAELRRHQGRHYDARQNLDVAQRRLAEPNRRELGAQIQVERAFNRAARRGWDDYRVDDFVDRARRLDAQAPRVLHVQGKRALYGRGRAERAARKLEAALEGRPYHCGILEDLREAYDRLDDSKGLTSIRSRHRKRCDR